MELAPLFHSFFSEAFQYVITALISYIAFKLKFVIATWQLLIKAVQIILGQLIRAEYRQAKKDGWISTTTFKRVEEMYSVYHAINGNGTISSLWENFTELEMREMEV